MSYKQSFETPEGMLYIAMQYCEGGDLYTKLKEQKGVLLEERQVVEWFVQIAMALQVCVFFFFSILYRYTCFVCLVFFGFVLLFCCLFFGWGGSVCVCMHFSSFLLFFVLLFSFFVLLFSFFSFSKRSGQDKKMQKENLIKLGIALHCNLFLFCIGAL